MKCANDIKLGACVTTSKDKEIIEGVPKEVKSMSRRLLHENHLLGIDSFGDEHWESENLKSLGIKRKKKRATFSQYLIKTPKT